MAITFSFSTTPILSGHAIRIYNTSLNWGEYDPLGTDALLTISTLDEDPEFAGGINIWEQVISGDDLVGDFFIDIFSADLYGEDKEFPDDILTFNISTTGMQTLTYSTDEVIYYKSWKYKTEVCFDTVNDVDDMNSMEIRYACMINLLYQGLMADIFVANTTGIYNKFNVFARLRHHHHRHHHDIF
jgi:hypothetical protein